MSNAVNAIGWLVGSALAIVIRMALWLRTQPSDVPLSTFWHKRRAANLLSLAIAAAGTVAWAEGTLLGPLTDVTTWLFGRTLAVPFTLGTSVIAGMFVTLAARWIVTRFERKLGNGNTGGPWKKDNSEGGKTDG